MMNHFFIRAFMTIVNQCNLELKQMNVKTTFYMETLKRLFTWKNMKVV